MLSGTATGRYGSEAIVQQRTLVELARRGDHDAFAVLVRASVVRLDRAARLIVRLSSRMMRSRTR
jgi:hypothetical protein